MRGLAPRIHVFFLLSPAKNNRNAWMARPAARRAALKFKAGHTAGGAMTKEERVSTGQPWSKSGHDEKRKTQYEGADARQPLA